jgi:hypothetical protein
VLTRERSVLLPDTSGKPRFVLIHVDRMTETESDPWRS